MDSSDVEKRLNDLIAKLTERNQVVQEKKASGPGGWIVAVVLALLSVFGIGIAMYLAGRRSRELAKAKTELEQAKIDLDQKAHRAQQEKHIGLRKELLKTYKKVEVQLLEHDQEIRAAVNAHAARQKEIEGLKAWDDINAQ